MTAPMPLFRRRLLQVAAGSALLAPHHAIAGNAPPEDLRPAEQRLFESRVATAYWTWRRLASNELRRSQLAEERGRELLDAMTNKTSFSEWQLVVGQVGLDNDGHAWVGLTSMGDTTPKTILTNVAVTTGDTLVQRLPPSLIHIASTLERGDCVFATGEFFPDQTDGYLELGRLVGKPAAVRMQFPQFCARYTALRRAAKDHPTQAG